MLILMFRRDAIDDARPTRAAVTIPVHGRFPTLRAFGIAVERFSRYVHRDLKPHRVDTVLLTCVLAGRGRHVMGGESFAVGSGSVGITHYGQVHDLLTEGPGLDVVNLYLDLEHHPLPVMPRALQGVLATILSPHPGLINRLNRRVQLQFPCAERMAQPLHRMLREQRDREDGYETVMRHELTVLLIECCRVARDSGWRADALGAARQPAWLERVAALIEQRFDEPLGLDDMVTVAGVSKEHLCRRFQHYAGRSPIAYLNDRRIQAATWRLRTTSARIADIALACGFNDLGYFNRQFKARVGMTPSRYRGAEPGER